MTKKRMTRVLFGVEKIMLTTIALLAESEERPEPR
jgi:hypothetical protein